MEVFGTGGWHFSDFKYFVTVFLISNEDSVLLPFNTWLIYAHTKRKDLKNIMQCTKQLNTAHLLKVVALTAEPGQTGETDGT